MSSQRERSRAAAPASAQPPPAAAHTQQHTDEPVDRPPRRITVVAGITSATILFLALLTLFVFRALEGREPEQVATVVGNESWLGAQLWVSGPSLVKEHRAVLGAMNRHSVPFFLPPGEYDLRVLVDGQEAYSAQFRLDPRETIEIPLPPHAPRLPPATAPSTSPATRR